LTLLVPRKRSIQPNECFLNHVLRVVRLDQHRARKTQAARVIRLDDLGKRTDIAELRTTDRLCVESGGLSRVWQR